MGSPSSWLSEELKDTFLGNQITQINPPTLSVFPGKERNL